MQLTPEEKRVLDYALCYLNANVDDKAIEDLGIGQDEIAITVQNIQGKVFPEHYAGQ